MAIGKESEKWGTSGGITFHWKGEAIRFELINKTTKSKADNHDFSPDVKYIKGHTGLYIAANVGTLGITEFAQSESGRIVYAGLSNDGYSFEQVG